MPSGPGALPFFRDLMALMISALVGGFVLMHMGSTADGMSGTVYGGGLLRISKKCSVHLFFCLSSLVMVLPFLSLTGLLGLKLFPDKARVIS